MEQNLIEDALNIPLNCQVLILSKDEDSIPKITEKEKDELMEIREKYIIGNKEKRKIHKKQLTQLEKVKSPQKQHSAYNTIKKSGLTCLRTPIKLAMLVKKNKKQQYRVSPISFRKDLGDDNNNNITNILAKNDDGEENLQAREEVKASIKNMVKKYNLDSNIYYELFTNFMSLYTVDKNGRCTIGIDTFLQFTPFIKHRAPETAKRLLIAAGVIIGTNSISIEEYVKLTLLLKYFVGTRDDYIDFWLRFLNPEGKEVIPNGEHFNLLEMLARGCCYQNHTLMSTLYTKNLNELLMDHQCVDQNKNLFMSKLEHCFRTEAISIESFNEGLKLFT